MKIVSTLAVAASLTLLSSLPTLQAQEQRRPDGDRGRGNFNPDEMRKRFADILKGSLKVSDEEWTVIQPLIEKIEEKRSAARGGGGIFGRPPGGGDRPSGGGDRPPGSSGGGDDRGRSSRSSGSPESNALRETLQKENASSEEIQAKLAALRDSRKKALAELEAVRGDLKSLVTPRQEAVLVTFGLLE